ncbi:MAG TPA: ribonuclease D [Kiritimatiellia bacterium]|nr:ribonuclease D [Kiritimatiellia bacterium]HMO98122.1 ribonuclease D [Kiritimatiellia bacterium]HMP96179.1 ribonuclease D [Kiritimatiellia bacterium]
MNVIFKAHDLPASLNIDRYKAKRAVAVDIETTGLDWRDNSIASFQVYGGGSVYVIKAGSGLPQKMIELIERPDICKVFHYALFDLNFMVNQWQIEPQNIACTKVASKLVDPTRRDHSLKSLLRDKLGIRIDKRMRTSNWAAKKLSDAQLKYAAKDVFYLPRLLAVLKKELVKNGQWELTQACYNFIPRQVQLDQSGIKGVFDY